MEPLKHWLSYTFQNVHLVAKWLPTLEKKIEQYSADGHADYRLFISAEPAATAESHFIPDGILQLSIKITNEPPSGMMANLHKALDNFSQVGFNVLRTERLFKCWYLFIRFHCFLPKYSCTENLTTMKLSK